MGKIFWETLTKNLAFLQYSLHWFPHTKLATAVREGTVCDIYSILFHSLTIDMFSSTVATALQKYDYKTSRKDNNKLRNRHHNKITLPRKLPSKRRVVINISGEIFETFFETLSRFPMTLLGNKRKRWSYFCQYRQQPLFSNKSYMFWINPVLLPVEWHTELPDGGFHWPIWRGVSILRTSKEIYWSNETKRRYEGISSYAISLFSIIRVKLRLRFRLPITCSFA